MTTDPTNSSSLRRATRVALMATAASLAMGLTLSILVVGPAAPVAVALVWLGLAMLVAIPVLNVVDVLITEWRLKEWPFVGAAAAVLALLSYAIAIKLWR